MMFFLKEKVVSYTLDLLEIKGSDYGRGCDRLYDVLEVFGRRCYIPTGQN